MTTLRTTAPTTPRLALAGRAAAATMVLTDVVMVIGRLAGWSGFTNDDSDVSAFADTVFFVFLASAALTIGIAIALLVKRDRPAAYPLLGALAVAVVLVVLESAGVFG